MSDTRTEFTASAEPILAHGHGVVWRDIALGKPTQNAFAEIVEGRIRDELEIPEAKHSRKAAGCSDRLGVKFRHLAPEATARRRGCSR